MTINNKKAPLKQRPSLLPGFVAANQPTEVLPSLVSPLQDPNRGQHRSSLVNDDDEQAGTDDAPCCTPCRSAFQKRGKKKPVTVSAKKKNEELKKKRKKETAQSWPPFLLEWSS